MPTIDGVEVYCSTSHGKLREYVDSERQLAGSQDGREKICYIEATDGEHFTFTLDRSRANLSYDLELFNYLEVQLSIDGMVYDKTSGRPWIYAQLCPIRRGPATTTTTFVGLQYEQDHRDNRTRRFQFSTRQIDCEGDDPHCTPIPGLGEITVKLGRYKKLGNDMNPRDTSAGFPPHYEPSGRVHEKHVKGFDLSHQVQITPPQVTAPRTVPYIKGYCLDDFSKPFMTFKFLYRSKRALRALGFIERSPSPLPPPGPGGLDASLLSNMSPLELQKEIRRLELAGTRGETLKRESTELRGSRELSATLEPEPRAPRIKREATEIIDLEARGKRIKREPPEIIDLEPREESTEGRATGIIELD